MKRMVSSEVWIGIDRRKRALVTAVSVGLLLLLLVAFPGNADAQTASNTDPALEPVSVPGCDGAQVTMKQREKEMLDKYNAHRASKGLPRYCVDPALQRSAQKHSDDEAARNFFSHTNPDGKTSTQRIRDEIPENTCFSATGENLHTVWADTTVSEVFTDWMNSAGHRANIERTSVQRIGIGTAEDADYSAWAYGDPRWGGGTAWTVNLVGGLFDCTPPPEDDGGGTGTDPGDSGGGGTDPDANRSAPSITNVRPTAGAKVRDRTPRFSAAVRDSQTDLQKSSVKVYIDNRRTYRFSYSSATDKVSGVSRKLKAGKSHTIRVVASDGAGKTSSKSTRFVVKR